ncbi:MAG: hypothetical protein JO210_14675, partial [Acidobacteriaceae bacterium]|nr:hypothetical protein [Acidobacteriaceae bacterium]
MSEALQLPPRELGHLFWSVLWHGIWTLRPVEAFWTRKIALHLLHARAGALDRPEHRPGARILLLGMILSCVDRVLQTCLFALEIPLFTKTVRILKDSAATPALLEPVLEKAFECYAVLGDSRPEADFTDPEIKADSRDLAVVLGELVTLRTAQAQLVTKPGRLLPALQLFLDSLPASELHEGLKEECLRWLETAGAVNARDYATCRAAWLVMTLWPMNTPAAILYLRPVLECTTQALDELLLELPRRLLQPQSASRRASDLASLSMAFWCQALAISFLTQGSEADENHRNDKLIGLARCGAETLAAIEELRRSRSQLIPQNDLLSRAMAREVGAVMLSAMLTACHYLRASHNHSFSQEVVEEIGAVFLRMEQTLAFPLPKI